MRLTVSNILIETPVEWGTHEGACGICGVHTTGAYHRNEILDKTSANLTAIFELNRLLQVKKEAGSACYLPLECSRRRSPLRKVLAGRGITAGTLE